MILIAMALLLVGGPIAYVVYRRVWNYPRFRSSKGMPADKCVPQSRIVAHRGSRLEGLPENSLAAFKDAFERGADVVELDVWLTKDKVVAIHHDETLLRVTGVADRKIWEQEYDSLPPLLTNVTGQCERIKEVSSKVPSNYVNRIPRLEELLELLPPDHSLNIEFKQDSWDLVKEVHRLLVESGKKHQVHWFSLNETIAKKLRSYDPTIPTVVSIQNMLMIILLFHTGLLPFVSLEDAVFGITIDEIKLANVKTEKAFKNSPEIVQRFVAWLMQGKPPKFLMQPELFTHLRRRGIPTWFMTVNTEVELKMAIEAGATGVLTDKPGFIHDLMEKNCWRFKLLYE